MNIHVNQRCLLPGMSGACNYSVCKFYAQQVKLTAHKTKKFIELPHNIAKISFKTAFHLILIGFKHIYSIFPVAFNSIPTAYVTDRPLV